MGGVGLELDGTGGLLTTTIGCDGYGTGAGGAGGAGGTGAVTSEVDVEVGPDDVLTGDGSAGAGVEGGSPRSGNTARGS